MTKEIKALYAKAGLSPPDGKGIHTKIFHECVVAIKKKIKSGEMSSDANAYAICMDSLGKTKAVKKSHQR